MIPATDHSGVRGPSSGGPGRPGNRETDTILFTLRNIVLFPFRLLWNLLVAVAIIGFGLAWWGFLFGSGVVFIIVLIFAPSLFLLPGLLTAFFTPLWPPEPETIPVPSIVDEFEKEYEEEDR